MARYWFARRFPVGHPRNAMSPVTPEGFRVAWTFVGWMVGGALAACVLVVVGIALIEQLTWAIVAWALAVLVFVGCSIYGAWFFISQTQGRGDQRYTVEDYKAGRMPPETEGAA